MQRPPPRETWRRPRALLGSRLVTLLVVLQCCTRSADAACSDLDGRSDLRHREPPLYCHTATADTLGEA